MIRYLIAGALLMAPTLSETLFETTLELAAADKNTKKVTANKTKQKKVRPMSGFIKAESRQWAPSMESLRCYNWKGTLDIHTVGNAVLVIVPWFAYDYQISGGSIPPGVAVANELHKKYADNPEVVVVAYSSRKQTGISELIRRRGCEVPFATCAEFPDTYRAHSERSSYSYGLIMVDRNGKVALKKSDYSSSEGRGSSEAKQYINTINILRDEKRAAGVPEITPPEIPEVSDRSMGMIAKSLKNGVIGSNYKKLESTLAKDPDHADAKALKAAVDTWIEEQRLILTNLESSGATFEASEFAGEMAKVTRMSSLETEFKDTSVRLRKAPEYKEGQNWIKTVETVYTSPASRRQPTIDKFLKTAKNDYYREQANNLAGK